MTTTTTADDVNLEEVDLLDFKWFQDGPPHALFARMREEAPIRWNRLESEGYPTDGFWSVTRHADVSAISRDTKTFSSHRAGVFLHPDLVMPLDVNRNLLLYKDPPEHTKYRKILQTAFVPNTVNKLETEIRARVTQVLDQVVEAGTCDFVKDVAIPIPLGVLAQLMGIADEDIPKLLHWTEGIEHAQMSGVPGGALDVFMEMAGFLHATIAEQVAAGNSDSLVMRMRAAEVDGQQLDDSEILVFFGLLVFAGNDTTRNTTANGLLALLQHPEQLRQLRDDPSLIPNAVEEILRYTSVVNYFVRTATCDTELNGQAIKEGDKLLIWYQSASRDDDAYEDPQRFDVTRTEHDHKAFGGGGRHFCLGAGLARLELRVIFEEVLRRFDDLQQAGPEARLESVWANSLTSLPVTFTPGPREG
ncbi:MAG: cytochrome [Solirubrobacterales bacterium]|nr:cytochrome [Solirubrobacterales bacterium]